MNLPLLAASLALLPALLLLPGTLMLLVYTVWGAHTLPLIRHRRHLLPGVVVIPAHNEAANIAATLRSLQRSDRQLAELLVIADHCNDATARIAHSLGATVLARDSGARGKGAALADAFDLLLQRPHPPAWVAVVDADTVVSSNFIPEIARMVAGGAAAVQVHYTVSNAQHSPLCRLMLLALAGFNCLRPRARQRLGCSSGLLGNGFALSLEALRRVPHHANSLVEDSEYHLALVAAGYRVQFLDHVQVAAEMPETLAAARSQRCRWEGGRWRLLARQWQALRAGQARLEPTLELLTLPVASQLTLSCLLLAAPGPARWLAAANLLAITLYTAASARIADIGWRDLGLLPTLLHYLWWKLRLLPAIVATALYGRWQRTPRKGEI